MQTIGNIENSLCDQVLSSKPSITTEIRMPSEALETQLNPDIQWLRELREMRGRVLYEEGGRNPVFLSSDGTFSDTDPFDLQTYHVLLRISQRIVACARVAPLDCSKAGYISTLLGQKKFDRILHDLGIPLELNGEASRWIVATDFRNLGLGPRVVATSLALAHSLGLHGGFVLAATRRGQDQLLCRMGAQPVNGVALPGVCGVDGEHRLLYFNIDPPKILRKQFARAIPMLGLP